MADFDTIKHEIDANIPDNNVQYITAKKVRDTLNDMVDEINEAKQDTLVSGTNIKTVNGYTLLGEGNIEIEGGSIDLSSYVTKEYLQQQSYINSSELSNMSYITQTDLSNAGYLTSIPSEYITSDELAQASYVTESQLTSMSYITQSELDAMGYATASQLGDKQDTLVSGINIKTINNESLLGSGNITIEGGYVDFSSYVTYDWLEAQSYLTEQALSNMSYITQTDLDGMSYVTEQALSQASYITMGDVSACGYITSSDLPDMSSYATMSYVETYYATIESLAQNIDMVEEQLIDANILVTDPETGDWTPDSMASQSYVADYVNEHAPMPDLSAYVTKTELSGMSYVTQTALSGMGYITSIPADYITQTDLDGMGYVTEQALSQASYITMGDVSACGYITSTDLPDMSSYATLSYLETYYATIESLTQNIEMVEEQLIGANILVTDPETGDWTPDSMASQTYVADYVAAYAPEPDLSAYVTKIELSGMSYVTQTALTGMGYLTSIPSEYITSDELAQASYVTESQLTEMSYITQTELDSMSYATLSYLETYYATIESLAQNIDMVEEQLIGANILVTDPETGDWTPDSMASQSYVADYVATYAPTPDLSSYVTKDELNQASYVTSTDLDSMGYITTIPIDYATYAAISAMGYITSIPSEYVTESELSSMGYITSSALPTMSDYVSKTELSQAGYVTATELSNASYATTTDLVSYLNIANFNRTVPVQLRTVGLTTITTNVPNTIAPQQLTYSQFTALTNPWVGGGTLVNYVNEVMPKIDENIIPNTTNTYTLGDSTHLYDVAYVNRVNGPDIGMVFRLGNTGKLALYSTAFRPATNDSMSLGTTNQQWAYTYSANFIENGTNIKDIYATKVDLGSYLPLAGGTMTGATYFTYDTYIGGLPDVTAYIINQTDYDNLSAADKNKELLYVISDQQPYQDNSLVTETELASKGYLTADNFIYDTYTGTLTINI